MSVGAGRALLAQALFGDRMHLVPDEPTNNPINSIRWLDVLNQRNSTMVIISRPPLPLGVCAHG
jgi:ATPase subunit of ABC transporter with duplicated ATPase domains